ncbi:MAG TPA: DNA repair protein RadC [Bacilli bacterium]|nr:DNA repair protein RadC [Bacilli bacterium]
MRICEMVTSERPREKAIALGIERLSEVELLALLIGSGTSGLNSLECASKLLYMKGGLPGLAKIKQPIDIKVEGIGRARSLIIIAAIELANRLAAVPQKSYLPVWHSETIFNRYRHRFSATNEKLMILYFSRQKEQLGEDDVYLGTGKGFGIDLRDIFARVLRANAYYFILIHNHPSGSLKPSRDDVITTSEVRSQAPTLGIQLLDHIILTDQGYFSFSQNGWADGLFK